MEIEDSLLNNEPQRRVGNYKKITVFAGLLLVVCIVAIVATVSITSASNSSDDFASAETDCDGRVMDRYDLTEMMNNPDLVCNDGTEAVYYFATQKHKGTVPVLP